MTLPSESEFQSELWKALSGPGRRMRFNRTNAGRVLDRDDRGNIRGAYRGAAKGTGDLGGLAAPDGLHTEVEVKVKAKTTNAQRARERTVNSMGGVYVKVRWQLGLDMAGNVARGLELVDAAIAQRRAQREEFYSGGGQDLAFAELVAENDQLHAACALVSVSISDLHEDPYGLA